MYVWDNTAVYNLIPKPTGWENFFIENGKECLENLNKIADVENLCPAFCDIFRSYFDLHPRKVKVLILGQDPYPNKNLAIGRAFGVPQWAKPPGSLYNIFKEVVDEGYSKPQQKTLKGWAKQGVLLLNTSLTTEEGKPKSHEFWKPLVWKSLIHLTQRNPDIICVAWGKDAQHMAGDSALNFSYILESAHPSPLSANKGFFGHGHFKKINNILNLSDRIDWGR